MASQPADKSVVGPVRETIPGLNSQNSTSLTSGIENTKIEAEVYRSLNEFDADTSIIDARTIVDQGLLIVRYWSVWLDLVGKRFARDEFTPRMELGFAAARTSAEALKFCLSKGIVSQLGTAIDLASKYFSIIGSPSVRLVQDPEIERAFYLMLEIQVRGTVRDNVMSHRSFANETAKLLGSSREIIRLHYDII
jgi:hypothetical protein